MKILRYFTIFLLAGCAASGIHVSEDQVTEFKKHKTTYDEVVAKLGPPTQKTRDSEGNVEINYIYSEYTTRAETFIPYVGGFVGGSDMRSNTANFKFNSVGILQDYTFSETSLGTSTNLSAGVPNDRVPTKTRTND